VLTIAMSVRAIARKWRARYLARRQLASLSDRELHDIGTCRAEIACEISKPVWQK
jgi:uncharacterized protein YjiS (DUF1127 family)